MRISHLSTISDVRLSMLVSEELSIKKKLLKAVRENNKEAISKHQSSLNATKRGQLRLMERSLLF